MGFKRIGHKTHAIYTCLVKDLHKTHIKHALSASPVQIWTHLALKPTCTPRPELRKGAANSRRTSHSRGRPRRNTLHLARTRSFASPARTHATHETKTKTKRSRSPGSGLPSRLPLNLRCFLRSRTLSDYLLVLRGAVLATNLIRT